MDTSKKILAIALMSLALAATTSAQTPTTTSSIVITGLANYAATTVPCPDGCTWPAINAIPTPLPQWVSAINMSSIPAIAPVQLASMWGPPINPTPDSNPNCDWSFIGQCRGPDDIFTCPKPGVWGLTYDDGPQRPTPLLLNYLHSNNQKATFFVIGSNALQFPDVLRLAYQNGHQIAIHTWSHPYLTNLTNEQVIGEMMWTATVIKATIGVTPIYMRPPRGDVDNRIRALMKAMGFKVIIWDHDTSDWMSNMDSFNPLWIDANVTQWAATKNSLTTGIISLEHDLYNQSVLAAIRSYPAIKNAGWQIMPVADCLSDPNYYFEQLPPVVATGKIPSIITVNGTARIAVASGVPANASTTTTTTKSASSRSANGGLIQAAIACLLLAVIFI